MLYLIYFFFLEKRKAKLLLNKKNEYNGLPEVTLSTNIYVIKELDIFINCKKIHNYPVKHIRDI